MLKAARPFNVASPDCAEDFFAGSLGRCVVLYHAGSLPELADVLERCARTVPATPMTLDLIGHSTRGHHLLRLGRTPVDMFNPYVCRFFGGLAHSEVLTRLDVVAVRLLGCETAVTEAGQRTLRMLARTLRLPVFGTRKPLFKSHSNAAGFDPAFHGLLVEAADLRQGAAGPGHSMSYRAAKSLERD